jgi:serine protease Do
MRTGLQLGGLEATMAGFSNLRSSHLRSVASVMGAVISMMISPPALAEGQSCGMDAEQVYAKSEASVVEVFSLAINQFRVSGRILPSLGTGFLMADGIIVTNYHVIADAESVMIFDDNGSWDADIVGIDPQLDIAVLRVPFYGDGEIGLALAPANSPRVGQKVFPIGFPRGLGKSMSQGIVTGIGRVLYDSTSSWLSPYIQTDATTNPGNSGGPLLDDCGRVLGMMTRAAPPDVAENIAFAIPTGVLQPEIEAILADGHVSRPWHGLYGQMVTPPILALLGASEDQWADSMGFLVETVEPGSAADRAGLQGGDWPIQWGGTQFIIGGDIIIEVNGRKIDSRDVALDVVRNLKVGETVSLVYLRDGEKHAVSVTLPERPILEADLDRYRGAD